MIKEGGDMLTPASTNQRYYITIGLEEERQENSEEKVVRFSSASLFPTRKWEAVTEGGDMGIDHLMRRIKFSGSQYCQRLGGKARTWAHSRYTPVKKE